MAASTLHWCFFVVVVLCFEQAAAVENSCYYSSQRPVRLSSVARRLYSGTPVVTECDYVGVVGLFVEDEGQLFATCVGSLLEEDRLVISKECYTNWFSEENKDYDLYALADSYKYSRLTKTITVDKNSAEKLDPLGESDDLYTVKLNTPLTFNEGCIQPVCVPSFNIRGRDIDFNDCRIVGYGDTSNIQGLYNEPEHQLNEIKVKVDSSSIASNYLTVTRDDKKIGLTCIGDSSAPLICSHKATREWVTVGITVASGFPCSNGSYRRTLIASLLPEAQSKNFYNALQTFNYTNTGILTG